MTGQDYRESHLTKGADYHAIFEQEPQTAMLWRLEQRELDNLLRKYFPIEAPRYLDFACGTGRVINHLSNGTADPTGVDVSASMLAIAQRDNPGLRLMHADITRDNPLTGETFDLITAFRFFPNAQQPLRSEVISALVPMLSSRGILVFNNHLNESSNYRKLLKRTGRTPGHAMSMAEVANVVNKGGLHIIETVGFGTLPIPPQFFRPIARPVEALEWAMRNSRAASRADDVIVVAAHV